MRHFEQGDFVQGEFAYRDLNLVVRRYGDPAARPDARSYLLVHGIGVSARYFVKLIEQLRSHGIVYTVDMPGFGSAQPKPRRALSIEDLAELILAFADEWNIRNPVLVGHSMGTQIVVEMAIRNPGISDCLVLIGPVVDPAAPSAVRQGFRLLRDVFMEPPGSNWIVFTDYLKCGPRWYLTALPAMLSYRMEERLPLLTAFTLVIRGQRDPVAPGDWVEGMTRALLRPGRFEAPRAPHVAQYAAAPAVGEAILAHVEAAAAGNGLEHGLSGRQGISPGGGPAQ
jgi:pimeloyl-ACP methyl ester carboxylesterase